MLDLDRMMMGAMLFHIDPTTTFDIISTFHMMWDGVIEQEKKLGRLPSLEEFLIKKPNDELS